MWVRGWASDLKIMIVINVQPTLPSISHSCTPCWGYTGWTVLEGLIMSRLPVWPVQAQNLQRECQNADLSDDPWTCEVMMKVSQKRGGGKGGILIIPDLIPSLIKPDLAIYDSCLCPVASTDMSLRWETGRTQKLVYLCFCFNLLGGVAFDTVWILKTIKRSNHFSSEASDIFS